MPPKPKRFATTQLVMKSRNAVTRTRANKLGSHDDEGNNKRSMEVTREKSKLIAHSKHRDEIVPEVHGSRGMEDSLKDVALENEDVREDAVCGTTQQRDGYGAGASIPNQNAFRRRTRSMGRMVSGESMSNTEKVERHISKDITDETRSTRRGTKRGRAHADAEVIPRGKKRSMDARGKTTKSAVEINPLFSSRRGNVDKRLREGDDNTVFISEMLPDNSRREKTVKRIQNVVRTEENNGEDAVGARDGIVRATKSSIPPEATDREGVLLEPSSTRRRYPARALSARSGHGGNTEETHGLMSLREGGDGQVGGSEYPSAEESDFSEDDAGLTDAPRTSGPEGPATMTTRNYNYVNRVRAPPRPVSELLKRRSATADKFGGNDFNTWTCCKRLKCFRNVNDTYFRAQRSFLLKASQSERKKALTDMLQDDNKFYFNRRVVCTYFLYYGFRFSKDLQRTVKGTPKAPAIPLVQRIPKVRQRSDQREFIMSFLKSLAASTAEQMPDTSEQHLPFHQKKHVYDLFCESMAKFPVLGKMRVPASSYFVKTWNEQMKHLKVRAVKRFTKCTECESTRMALVAAAKEQSETGGILEIRRRHLQFIQRERASYVTRAQMAVTNPMKVCSVVVDGADQSNFGLPHFTSNTKDTRGEALKVKLVGLLEHGPRKALFLYTMTGQFETGANHVVECIHRWLNKKASQQGLSPTLFVQLDNCSRENKNRFLFAYLECLVAWGLFEEVQASFLPVGHTHSDIDQTFNPCSSVAGVGSSFGTWRGCTSRRLKVNDAVTMSDLQDQLRKSYTPTPSVSSLLHVANFSGLLQSSVCLETVPAFSQYRFFKFARRSEKPRRGTGRYSTTCIVKESCDAEWESFSKEHDHGFLKFAPDLSRTPKNVLTSPENGEKVTERIDSEEGRINDEKKVQALRELRDDVYRYKEDPFHWDLESSVEIMAVKGEVVKRPGTEEIVCSSQVPHTRVSYNLNSFVIVRPYPKTKECPFWLAQVLDQHRNTRGDVYEISIRWYEVKSNQNVFDGGYDPSFCDDKNGRSIPWIADIPTDAVMFNFPSLTCHNKIGRTVVRRIQSALHSQP